MLNFILISGKTNKDMKTTNLKGPRKRVKGRHTGFINKENSAMNDKFIITENKNNSSESMQQKLIRSVKKVKVIDNVNSSTSCNHIGINDCESFKHLWEKIT